MYLRSILLWVTFTLLFTFSTHGQRYKEGKKPKLVVGIVVDQMRYDYIYRYWDRYSDNGIKRLVENGFSFENTNFNYFPTYTGPGHASVYTGATPSSHGIVGNDWYDRSIQKRMYCAGDSTVTGVGGTKKRGQISPKNLTASTISDQLKLNSAGKAKVIALALKDRGAALPGGGAADAAYWWDYETGNFMTSTYYMDTLPDWVERFNKAKHYESMMDKGWETLYPIKSYVASIQDDNDYEIPYGKDRGPVFPKKLRELSGNKLWILRGTPHGNTLTRLFAEAAIQGEDLGKDEITDFLAVSFSSTDYVGHQFGPSSIEIEDTYLRLDKDIATLLQTLDKQVGKGEYILFLTADHGAVEVPQYLMDNGIEGGYFDPKIAEKKLEEKLELKYGNGNWIEDFTNQQVYLNHELLEKHNLDVHQVASFVSTQILKMEGIAYAISSKDLITNDWDNHHVFPFFLRGYTPERSGDLFFATKPGWLIRTEKRGTSHGSPYEYDTHVPLLFYGKGIKKGASNVSASIPDIAVTLANLLKIQAPTGATGKVLSFD